MTCGALIRKECVDIQSTQTVQVQLSTSSYSLATLVWRYTISSKLVWVGLMLLHAKWLARQLVWLFAINAEVGYNLYC